MHSINDTSTASRRAGALQRPAEGSVRELSESELLLVAGAWGGYGFGFPGGSSGHRGGMVPGDEPVHAYASYTERLYDNRLQANRWHGHDLEAWMNAP